MSSKTRSGKAAKQDERADELQALNEAAVVRALARYIFESERKEARLRQSRKLG